MNHTRSAEILLVLTAAAIAGTGAGISRLPFLPMMSVERRPDLVARTTAVIGRLRDRSNDRLAEKLPLGSEERWAKVVSESGPLVGIGLARVERQAASPRVSVPLTFARDERLATVEFDGAGKVLAIDFTPHP